MDQAVAEWIREALTSSDQDEAESSSQPSSSSLRDGRHLSAADFVAALAVFVAVFLVGSMKLKRMAPVTEGWWQVYARWIDSGKVPYRDFNLITPPGMAYITWFFSRLVGEDFLRVRVVGVVLSSAIGVGLFAIYRRLTKGSIAVLAAVFSTIIFYSTLVPVYFDYNYFAIAFLIFSAVAVNAHVNGRRSDHWLLYASGALAACSFLVKTNWAVFYLLFLGISYGVVPVVRQRSIRAARDVFRIGIGFLAPIAMVVVYFASRGALPGMLRSIFVDAPAAKGNQSGSLTHSLTLWMSNLVDAHPILSEAEAVLLIVLALLLFDRVLLPILQRCLRSERWFGSTVTEKYLRVLSIIVIVVVACAAYFEARAVIGSGDEGILFSVAHPLSRQVLPHTFLFPVVFIAYLYVRQLFRRDMDEWLVILSLCMGLIWGAGSSGGIDWYATGIPIGLILIWVFNSCVHKRIGEPVLFCIAILLSLSLVAAWASSPYSWWGLNTGPSWQATATSSSGLTSGLAFEPSSLKVLEKVEAQLATVKTCKGGYVVFPSTPLFVLDQDATPRGRDAEFWFDFVSQDHVRQATAKLKREPPSGVVMLRVPKPVWQAHSDWFNASHPYAQRDLEQYLLSLTTDGYVKHTYELSTSPGYSISVLTDPDCAPSGS